MPHRRQVLGALIGAAALAPRARAAEGRRLLLFSPAEAEATMYATGPNRYYGAFFAALRDKGFVEGTNLVIERLGRESATGGLAAAVDDAVKRAPDVVYVIGPGAPLFARATATIPVVALTGDPVATGITASLARPSANLTGVSVDTGPELHGKRLAILKEFVPQLKRVAWIPVRSPTIGALEVALKAACESAGIALTTLPVTLPSSDAGYRALILDAAPAQDAFIVGDNPDSMSRRTAIIAAMAEAKKPALYPLPEFVADGGLISYSFDLTELNRQAAAAVARILSGTPVAEIPWYQAAKFELALNLKTAKALGISFPPTLLATADAVVEQ